MDKKQETLAKLSALEQHEDMIVLLSLARFIRQMAEEKDVSTNQIILGLVAAAFEKINIVKIDPGAYWGQHMNPNVEYVNPFKGDDSE